MGMWMVVAVAALAAWPEADVPALDGPLQGLSFGMSVEEVWAAVPDLRDGIDVVLEEGKYDDVVTRIPALARRVNRGGNRWINTKSRNGSWPAVEGVEWELRVDRTHGLTMITARFASEEALRKLAEGAWGPPDVDARWDFWYAEAGGVRAAFTGCHSNTIDGVAAGPQSCKLEWMPFRPVESMLATEVFPDGGTWVGQPAASLPLGPGDERDTTTRYKLRPSRADLWVPVEVQHAPGGAAKAYRLPLSFTYDSGEEARIWEALTAQLGELSDEGACKLGRLGTVPVRACPGPMQVVLTVGEWD